MFLALSLYFKVSNSVFSYVVKNFWYDPLILLRHTWIKTEKKGVVSKTIYHIRQNRVLCSRRKKRRKRYTKYTEEKEAEDENWQKNADFLPFLALFQGKKLCFVLFGKKFLIRPLPFGLNSCMTQQNKGVSKIFYYIRKNRVPYLEIKWKPQKNLQFYRLVVVKVVVV